MKKKANPELLDEQLRALIGADFDGISYSPVNEEVTVHLKQGVPYKRWEAVIEATVNAHDANERSARQTKALTLDTEAKAARRATLDDTPTLAKLLAALRNQEKRIRYLESLLGVEE